MTSDMVIDAGSVEPQRLRFSGMKSFESTSSWDQLTDTATIIVPAKLKWKENYIYPGLDPFLKKGMDIEVKLGYDNRNHTAFKGYLNIINADIPVTLECEDEAWKLKQSSITKSYKDVDLKTLLKDLLPTFVFEAPDVRLGPFRITRATAAEVLDELKKTYFMPSFFRNGILYVGFAYWPELQTTHKIAFDRHVVEHELKYVKEEDTKIKLTIVTISPTNEKKEYEFGDEQGEQRTLYYYDKNAAEVNHIGKEEIRRLRYTGYRGTMTIFGEPFVQHGDVVDLTDPFYPGRDGRYLVKTVTRQFNEDGYRQVLELDVKI
jgi:hypothetical protein